MSAAADPTHPVASPAPGRGVAIVTGAAGGIGAGLVAAFRRAGYSVVATASLVDRPDSIRPAAVASLTKGGLAAVTRSLAME
jgi:NADP-dependent 3-hydroxy acid dehydrogenase YdfG